MTPPAHSVSQLTTKQLDVLALIADSRTSKEIAVLLGISESAVNQRIEAIRSRLGCVPRGELARLYRQEMGGEAPGTPIESTTWQKIHLPDNAFAGQSEGAESISSPESNGSHPNGTGGGDGSQLSAFIFQPDDNWLWRENRATALVRFAAMAAIIAFALVIAFGVTDAIGTISG